MRQQKVKRPRNHLARHPLMKKGGVHQKTKKAQRKVSKQALRTEYPVESLASTRMTCIRLASDRIFRREFPSDAGQQVVN